MTASGDDEGQLTILVIGLGAILPLLVALVTDASVAFLAERQLSAAADGAAVAAAGTTDDELVYTGAARNDLPLSRASVLAAVRTYVDRAGLTDPGRFADFAVERADTDGVTATVVLHARVPLPFVRVLPVRWARGLPIDVTASARAPLRD